MTETRKNIVHKFLSHPLVAERTAIEGGDQRGTGTWSDFSKTAWRLGGRKGGREGGKEEGGLREEVGGQVNGL